MTDISTIETTNSNAAVFSTATLDKIMAFATIMADGKSTLPKHLSNNVSDCMAVSMQAAQWGMNPFAVAQKTHLVNGVLGYEAQLVNAVIVTSGAIQGRFKYDYGGSWENFKADNKQSESGLYVKVGAQISGEDQITWGEPLFISNITTRNSPLWKTAPKQQIAYLAVKYWARLYCPEVILGVYSTDELTPARAPLRDVTPRTSQDINSLIEAKPEPVMSLEDNAVYDDIISQMGLCQTIKELKEVGDRLNTISINSAAREAASDVYKACSEKIKNAAS